MLAVIFGLIYLRQILDQIGVQNINGVIFLCITNSSFSNLFAVLNVNFFFSNYKFEFKKNYYKDFSSRAACIS
jgi:hypothetical protein